MGWRDWFRRSEEPERPVELPGYEVGQYVSYVLEREDSSYLAMRQQVIDARDNSYYIIAQSKEDGAQTLILFSFNEVTEGEEPEAPEIVEMYLQRGDEQDAPHMLGAHATIHMNMLLLRHSRVAREALLGDAAPVELPCEVSSTYLVRDPWPSYDKLHDLNPRVPITGIARSQIEGHAGTSIVTTAFGSSEDGEEGVFDDYIDWDHAQIESFGQFIMSFPATWFMRRVETDLDGCTGFMSTMNGGATIASSMTVATYSGDRAALEAFNREFMSEYTRSVEHFGGIILPAEATPELARYGAPSIVWRGYEADAIDGFSVDGVYVDHQRGLLVNVMCFVCVRRDNPRHDDELALARECMGQIVRSFAWTHAA